MSEAGLRLEGVGFAYGDTPILSGIDLTVAEGEFVCLLGPSGCGKSTLLRLLAGLEPPGTGRITQAGAPLGPPGSDRGVVFQHYALFPWMRVVDNVALAIAKARPATAKRRRREEARAHLSRVGLAEAADKYPFQLSGGMQQRAAIARALALESPVLLMDEPFGALDPVNRARLQDVLVEVWQGAAPRKSVVFVTHDVDEALYLGDRIAVLGASPGHLIADLIVPFGRPRVRAELLNTEEFHLLREEIAELLSADTLAQLKVA